MSLAICAGGARVSNLVKPARLNTETTTRRTVDDSFRRQQLAGRESRHAAGVAAKGSGAPSQPSPPPARRLWPVKGDNNGVVPTKTADISKNGEQSITQPLVEFQA